MALRLYRRHRAGCEGGHPEDFRSGEFEEGRRGWKKCACLIHASGTIGGKFNRKQTGKAFWEEARIVATAWENTSWNGEVSPAYPCPESASKVTIEEAVNAFLAEHKESSSFNTQRKTRYLLNALSKYSKARGYIFLEQWTTIDVRAFRTSWGVAPNTASNNMVIVKSFFEFCVNNDWLLISPAKSVKAPKSRSIGGVGERIPFSDDELQRMFNACETLYGKLKIRWSRDVHHYSAGEEPANYRYKWTGQDLADFIAISTYTGLRISDVSTFHIDRLLTSGECHVRTTKTGRKVFTWIPTWLQERIRQRALERGSWIFGTHRTTDMNVITDVWRRKLNKLWALCGPWKEKPTPHRFRHTFARILLSKPGVTVRDVAELLGDTEEMILRHYSAWMPERQERLTKVLRDAFYDKPKPALANADRKVNSQEPRISECI